MATDSVQSEKMAECPEVATDAGDGAEEDEEGPQPEPTASQQLHDVFALIYSGRLRGELPDGFLRVFSHLPNEILVNIWGYVTTSQRLSFRLVCKRWKSLWESLREAKREVNEMQISIVGDKLYIKTKASEYYGREVTIEDEPAAISQFFSLVRLGMVYWSNEEVGGTVQLEGGAANAQMFDIVKQQKTWRFDKFVIKGDARSLTEDSLCDLMASLTQQCVRIRLHFIDVNMAPGVISDRVIASCGNALHEFIVSVDSACECSPLALTDASLPVLFEENALVIIPPCKGVTLRGICTALQSLEKVVPMPPNEEMPSEFATCGHRHGRQRFVTGVTDEISAKALAKLKVKMKHCVVEKQGYNEARAFCDNQGGLPFLEATGTVTFMFKPKCKKNEKSETVDEKREFISCWGNEYSIEVLSPKDLSGEVAKHKLESITVSDYAFDCYVHDSNDFFNLFGDGDDDYSNDYDYEDMDDDLDDDDMW